MVIKKKSKTPKLKTPEISDPLRKKKKKKKRKEDETSLVPLSTKEQKLLKRSLTKTNAMASLFGQDSLKIQELISEKDNDNAFDMANRSMLSFMLDLIPLAETRYREDARQSNAYAMIALISQARELISDLQAADDKSVIKDKIVYDVVKPTMMTLAQFLIDSNYQLKRELTDFVIKEHQQKAHLAIDNSTKAAGQYVQAMFSDLKDRLNDALGK